MCEWLLAAAASGLFYVLLLFLGCFACVHAGHLALLGWRAMRPSQKQEEAQKEPPKQPEQEKKPDEREEKEEKPQPVYLLVEKKRVKKKPKYEEPKRVEVKKNS